MSALQIKDWATATVDPGATYELVYLITGPTSGRQQAVQDFKTVLDQRSGVTVKGVQTVGDSVVRAWVRIGYVSAPLGAQLGPYLFTGVGTRSEHRFALTNVFMLREGGVIGTVLSPVAKLDDKAQTFVGGLAIDAADTLENIGLAPRHLLLYGAIAVGALFLFNRR